MKNKDGKFRFKKFAVSHHRSSMKVGVDGVFVGAWATPTEGQILDVGCGCGVISLILAQRTKTAFIQAIDIDCHSIEEAKENFSESEWNERLEALQLSFEELKKRCQNKGKVFSLIVSNPPYFDSGVDVLDDARKLARHQGALSPEVLLRESGTILQPHGKLVMIVPEIYYRKVLAISEETEMKMTRTLFIKDHIGSKIKRTLIEFEKRGLEDDLDAQRWLPHVSDLTMFSLTGEPTDEYRELCKDLYLKF